MMTTDQTSTILLAGSLFCAACAPARPTVTESGGHDDTEGVAGDVVGPGCEPVSGTALPVVPVTLVDGQSSDAGPFTSSAEVAAFLQSAPETLPFEGVSAQRPVFVRTYPTAAFAPTDGVDRVAVDAVQTTDAVVLTYHEHGKCSPGGGQMVFLMQAPAGARWEERRCLHPVDCMGRRP